MAARAISDQEKILKHLILKGRNTSFGKHHGYNDVHNYIDYKTNVPLHKYEEYLNYIQEIKDGASDVLWPGRPVYFAKTSGTTSGSKYIPITKESLPNHVGTAKKAFFCYLAETRKSKVLDGKLMFLSGSPVLDNIGNIKTGRLSGIVNHEIPYWLTSNQVPSYDTNCVEDWESKLDAIVEETLREDLRMISGIPPWVKMYYEKILERSGKKTVAEVFPRLQLFVYGGVHFGPYKKALEEMVGKQISSIETYPASEGFIAFQNTQSDPSLLLNTDSGIFFEFVPADEIANKKPKRYRLNEVKTGVDYALIINSNAGLWGYIIGDLVRFTSLDPYKIIVSGRVGQYTSAFGEHVISFEAEESIREVCEKTNAKVEEFTLAPQVNPPEGGKPYHEWFIDFIEPPENMDEFSALLDLALQLKNPYYSDLINGNVLRPLKITTLKTHGLREFLKAQDKLGGQNKVPRISNSRLIADQLGPYIKK